MVPSDFRAGVTQLLFTDPESDLLQSKISQTRNLLWYIATVAVCSCEPGFTFILTVCTQQIDLDLFIFNVVLLIVLRWISTHSCGSL